MTRYSHISAGTKLPVSRFLFLNRVDKFGNRDHKVKIHRKAFGLVLVDCIISTQ